MPVERGGAQSRNRAAERHTRPPVIAVSDYEANPDRFVRKAGLTGSGYFVDQQRIVARLNDYGPKGVPFATALNSPLLSTREASEGGNSADRPKHRVLPFSTLTDRPPTVGDIVRNGEVGIFTEGKKVRARLVPLQSNSIPERSTPTHRSTTPPNQILR